MGFRYDTTGKNIGAGSDMRLVFRHSYIFDVYFYGQNNMKIDDKAEHANLKTLNDWCTGTGVLHLWVNFQNRTGDWAVRVLTNALGKAHPLRTCTGTSLESVCAELLPKAQEQFEQRKAAIMTQDIEYQKKQTRNHYRDTREIEAMHHSADDF